MVCFSVISAQEKQNKCNHFGRGKSLSISKDKSIETWYGNVFFEAENIKIEWADSLRFDNKTNKLIAYNCHSYSFKGQKHTAEKQNKFSQIEYTLGDLTIQIK